MTGSGCVILYFSLFQSVCSLKEQFNISGIPGITHTCPESFFTSSFADTYRHCFQYCWRTTRCTACTWIPRSSVCRLHDGECSVPPETPVNTSCLFTEASTKHLSKHHPCQGRPCVAAQTCAAVEAASSFICLSVPATTFATASTTTAFDTADSTTTTPTTTTPTSTTPPTTSTTSAAEVADAASTTTPTTAITTFAIATATTIATTTAAAAVTANSTTTTTTTCKTPTSTTPTTATSTTPTTTTLLISCSFEYIGCYPDDPKDFREESDVLTREWCLVKCREGNYTFAGLEHYTHCFCGDSYDESVYPKKAESECNTPCKGNPQQMCGGWWRLSVFICR